MMSSASSSSSWSDLKSKVEATETGLFLLNQQLLRDKGDGMANTWANLRLFGEKEENVRVVFYKDTASWCPYCQKCWILLEEKKIPYKVKRINMRSYGDKPAEYLKLVPNGLLPAVEIDGKFQTESIDIMFNLDRLFSGPKHPSFWPSRGSAEDARAQKLMRLERDLFGLWCNLIFRPSFPGGSALRRFEEGLALVNNELSVTEGPWFLSTMSIVDLQFVTHVERMLASCLFWSGLKIRNSGKYPYIDRWFDAFESRESYIATKSDYYTHVCDIPPQYGEGYSLPGSASIASQIIGDEGHWQLPLPAFDPVNDIEPVSAAIDPGEEGARHEAAFKIVANFENIIKFSLRGAGKKGAKQFQAPLADPYAVPALELYNDMESVFKALVSALLQGSTDIQKIDIKDTKTINKLVASLDYFKYRIGVPRDMSYPAARQLRAYCNHIIKCLNN